MITPLRVGLLVTIGVVSALYIIINIVNMIKNRKKKNYDLQNDNTEDRNKTK